MNIRQLSVKVVSNRFDRTHCRNYWETVESRWVHAANRLTSIVFSFDHI